jgi:hypothetical protein
MQRPVAEFRDGDENYFVVGIQIGGLANRTIAVFEMFCGPLDRHGLEGHEPCPCGRCLDF